MKDEIFRVAIEVIKFANLLHNNPTTAQLGWLCKSYKHQHVLAYALSELCERPISPETNHAWEVVTEFYETCLKEDQQTNAVLENPLSRLMERATASRQAELERPMAPDDVSNSADAVITALRAMKGIRQPPVTRSAALQGFGVAKESDMEVDTELRALRSGEADAFLPTTEWLSASIMTK